MYLGPYINRNVNFFIRKQKIGIGELTLYFFLFFFRFFLWHGGGGGRGNIDLLFYLFVYSFCVAFACVFDSLVDW